MAASIEKVTYEGRCHCGAITFNIKYPQLEPPTSAPVLHCNCSICHRNGYLLIYPARQDLEITKGKDMIKQYSAYGGIAPHAFCSDCGSSVWIDAPRHSRGDVYCVNVRMLRGVELDQLTIEEWDGKSKNQPQWNEKYW